jgi:hypothetical protein
MFTFTIGECNDYFSFGKVFFPIDKSGYLLQSTHVMNHINATVTTEELPGYNEWLDMVEAEWLAMWEPLMDMAEDIAREVQAAWDAINTNAQQEAEVLAATDLIEDTGAADVAAELANEQAIEYQRDAACFEYHPQVAV